MQIKSRHWKRAAIIFIIIGLIFAARAVPLGDWLERVAQPLRNLGTWGVVLYALGYFAAGMFCLPCMPLTLAGGYIFGTFNGVISVHTGSTLAAAGGFLAGRFAGRVHADRHLRKSKRFRFIDDAIAHDGWKIVGVLRMHPFPFGASNYLYGMTSIDFRHYILTTTVAMLPGHLLYVHLGAVGGKHLTGKGNIGLLELAAPALGIVSTLLLTVVLTRIIRRHGEFKPFK